MIVVKLNVNGLSLNAVVLEREIEVIKGTERKEVHDILYCQKRKVKRDAILEPVGSEEDPRYIIGETHIEILEDYYENPEAEKLLQYINDNIVYSL